MDATTKTVKKGPGRPKKVWTEEELAAWEAEKAAEKAVKAAEKAEAKAVKAALTPKEKKALREAKKAAAPTSYQEIRKQIVALLALLPDT